MQESENALVKELFDSIDITSKKRPVTAATQFKSALAQLMETLLSCRPHYIRCIKPNDEKRAGHFDEQRIRHQARYLGLLENIRVRRAGFCYRMKYEGFIWRFIRFSS
jgi:myosin-1